MRSRYDYVQYDTNTLERQATFKTKFMELDQLVNALKDGRAKSLIFTKLEEAYCWVGKALRDELIEKKSTTQLQEARDNA